MCSTGAIEEGTSLKILKLLAAVDCRAQRALGWLWLMRGRAAMEDEGEIQNSIYMYVADSG